MRQKMCDWKGRSFHLNLKTLMELLQKQQQHQEQQQHENYEKWFLIWFKRPHWCHVGDNDIAVIVVVVAAATHVVVVVIIVVEDDATDFADYISHINAADQGQCIKCLQILLNFSLKWSLLNCKQSWVFSILKLLKKSFKFWCAIPNYVLSMWQNCSFINEIHFPHLFLTVIVGLYVNTIKIINFTNRSK